MEREKDKGERGCESWQSDTEVLLERRASGKEGGHSLTLSNTNDRSLYMRIVRVFPMERSAKDSFWVVRQTKK